MTQTYHVIMNGGKGHLAVRADSAATAMATALERNRGFSVLECFAGDQLDPEHPGLRARMDFPVPKHEALPVLAKVKREEPPCELFDDAKVIIESEYAKLRREKP